MDDRAHTETPNRDPAWLTRDREKHGLISICVPDSRLRCVNAFLPSFDRCKKHMGGVFNSKLVCRTNINDNEIICYYINNKTMVPWSTRELSPGGFSLV